MQFYIKAFIAGLIYLFLFIGVFFLFQNQDFYSNTLGHISQNYERDGSGIHRVSKPFTEIKDVNFERWDAAIYQSIKDRSYVYEESDYGYVRGAFFPLFPYTWKLLHVNSIGISLFNYTLYVLSLLLLIHNFLSAKNADKLIVFLVLVSLPSTIVFSIPYTESFFMFTGTLMFIGIYRNNYKLYFSGALALAMVRPATLFIFLSVILIELLILFRNRDLRTALRSMLQKFTPFILGYFLAVFIQFLSSGSFNTYLKAQERFEGKVSLIKKFSDWSVEGFGLSSFTVFFIALPVLFYTVYFILNRKTELKSLSHLFKFHDKKMSMHYILLICLLYISGITLFTILTSTGNLHSFFRFILCSPAFYFILVYVYNAMSDDIETEITTVLIASFFAYCLFLYATSYNGGIRVDFSFLGSYLLVLNLWFFVFFNKRPDYFKYLAITCLLLFNLVWNTYLFNCFLSDGWIFT